LKPLLALQNGLTNVNDLTQKQTGQHSDIQCKVKVFGGLTGQIQAVQFSDGEIIRQPLQIISLEVECLQIGKIPQKLVSDAFDPDVDHLQNLQHFFYTDSLDKTRNYPNFIFQNWRSDLTDVTAENGDIFYVGKPLQQQIEIKIGLFDVSQLQHSDIWGKFVSEC
jgi:hypothetical protein